MPPQIAHGVGYSPLNRSDAREWMQPIFAGFALSLEGAEERSHKGAPDFRVAGHSLRSPPKSRDTET